MTKLELHIYNRQIIVNLPGTRFTITYQLSSGELVEHPFWTGDDRQAAISLSDFRKSAWRAACKKAHQMGWISQAHDARVGSRSATPRRRIAARQHGANSVSTLFGRRLLCMALEGIVINSDHRQPLPEQTWSGIGVSRRLARPCPPHLRRLFIGNCARLT